MTRSKGRTGRPYRRMRERVLQASQICHLCSEAIDLTIKWPDPMSPSVDHIIPVNHLAPNDPRLNSISNAKPAHLGCNSRRGDGTRGTREALSETPVTTQDFYA